MNNETTELTKLEDLRKECQGLQASLKALEQANDAHYDTVCLLLTTLGVDPADWGTSYADAEAAIKCVLSIGEDSEMSEIDEWTDDPENLKGTVTGKVFGLLDKIKALESKS